MRNIRTALERVADVLDEGAREQRNARRDKRNAHQAMMHASIDAERLLERAANELRELRR